MFNVYFTALIIVAAIGSALAVVGWLFTVLMALGRKDYWLGAWCSYFPRWHGSIALNIGEGITTRAGCFFPVTYIQYGGRLAVVLTIQYVVVF